MFNALLRRVVSIELTSSVPPKIILPFSNSSKEFELPSTKTIGEFLAEVQIDNKTRKPISILIDGKKVPENSLLGSITTHEFTIMLEGKEIHVNPGQALFIRGNEKFFSKCFEHGIPLNEARSISRFLQNLEAQLPDEFSPANLTKAIENAKSYTNSSNKEEISILQIQLNKFQEILKKLESDLEIIKRKSERHADNALKLGLGVMFTQWFGIGYGTFVLYGWDVMEPFSYMVGSTWAVLGFSFFMMQRTEFEPASFREIIYKRKYDKLIKKNKISLERIDSIQKSIE